MNSKNIFCQILTESYLLRELTYSCVSMILFSHFNQTESVFTRCHVFARVHLILLIPPSYTVTCLVPGSVWSSSRHNFKMMQ